MTWDPAEPGSARGLRLAWFGHAVGARADGLTTYSDEVVRGLRERGAEVWFHHAERDGRGVPVDEAHRVGWPTLRFKTVTLALPGYRRQTRRWLERHQLDLVHASLSFTLADGWLGEAAAARGLATVATFHLPFGRSGSGRARVMHQLHRFWARRLGAYQRVIVFSQEHRERLAGAGADPGRIEVLPNAVDTERFRPGDSELRRERLAGAGLVLGYLGRMDPEKGVGELIEGFEEAGLGRSGRLLLAGSGSETARVERAARRDPRVLFLGPLLGPRQRVDFWRAVDVFCLPSSAEGLSLSLLEAMASGCAVAATPAGGAAELGEAVLRLDPGRLTASISGLLGELAADPERARRAGALARQEAVSHHGMTAMLTRLLGIYRTCLAGQS